MTEGLSVVVTAVMMAEITAKRGQQKIPSFDVTAERVISAKRPPFSKKIGLLVTKRTLEIHHNIVKSSPKGLILAKILPLGL